MKIVLIYAALPRAHPQIFHSHLIMKQFYCDDVVVDRTEKKCKIIRKTFNLLKWDFFLSRGQWRRLNLFDIFFKLPKMLMLMSIIGHFSHKHTHTHIFFGFSQLTNACNVGETLQTWKLTTKKDLKTSKLEQSHRIT